MAPSMKQCFYSILPRYISQKTRLHQYYSSLHHILFSKMNVDHLAISYDNKLLIPVDVLGDGNCLFRSLVESDIIPISDFKKFRSDLSNRIKILCIII